MKRKFLLNLIEDKKNLVGLLILIFCEISYAYTNFLTTHMHAHILPFSFIDSAIPFFPWSVWIYFSELLICTTAFYFAQDVANVARYLCTLVMITTIAIIIFIFFPTIFPRIHFPIPTDLDPFTTGLFQFVRFIDCPTNCLPSLHVAYSYSASFVFLQEQRSKFPLFFIWATLISISTLTTKQHYIWDVMLGLFFALTSYCIFLRWVPSIGREQLNN